MNVVCRQIKHEYTVLQKFTRIGYEKYNRYCCKYVRIGGRVRRFGKKKRDVKAVADQEIRDREEMYSDKRAKEDVPTYDWCLQYCTKTRLVHSSYG